MSRLLLAEEAIYPSDSVLQIALGERYPAYRQFYERLAALQISMEWRYYNDQKNWLCKCLHKKKNVFWFSVWEGWFQATFYFTETTYGGIPDHLKNFERLKNVGKLIPLIVKITSEDQLDALAQLIEYKKNLK